MEIIERIKTNLTLYGRKYPTAWAYLDYYRDKYKSSPTRGWQDWSFCPLDASRMYFKGDFQHVPKHLTDEVPVMLALGTWRLTQSVYRFDETVFNSVWDMEGSGKLPVDVLLHLPDWCVYIETPGKRYLNKRMFGFFVFLTENYVTKDPEMSFILDLENGFETLILFLKNGTIEQSIEALMDHFINLQKMDDTGYLGDKIVKNEQYEDMLFDLADTFEPLLSLVIFLCSQTSTIPNIEDRPQPEYNKKKKRMLPAKEPRVWEVAYRLGEAIRKADQQAKNTDDDKVAGVSVRPHIRRAHWHGYWTGPRNSEQKYVLKWLPPIPVNVTDENPTIPVVRRIRE